MAASGEPRPSAIGQALLALGDQWALLILQRALLTHARRFAQWRDQLGMSESVLAARIKELVAGGLLRPQPYRDGGRTRTEYLLTPQAIELWPLLTAIWSWEREWVERPVGLPDLVHDVCARTTDVDLGCQACGAAPVTARETDTQRGAGSAFGLVAVARHHRRTARGRVPRDALSYFPDTMEILGDRWSTALLAVAFLRVRRFADFQTELGMAPSVLSDRLRRFCDLGVLEPRAPVAGGRAEYRLTEKGLAFFPVLAFLVDWAQRWYPGPAGSGVAITHRACGKPFVPYLRCRTCETPLERAQVHFAVEGAEGAHSATTAVQLPPAPAATR
ncbi:winged helix-turn-helix transcriptional regulator [Streptomyces sp. 3214.6]|uniref:winged helix-turn-helix transcriptional regulator n=1 Tax=Streptomyces sp. 3214.6 TaxID=1882757 RepID=UPI00090B778B|nr:helix-turn-helix domain-containing protein [Streptomyces sp. 3214.6]SHI26104.1 transcriptional regulator, HxlR family [Streptomyces sp. 3214.6]